MASNLYSNIQLNPPKSKHSKEKLAAYKKHWQGVARVRDLLSDAYIHEGVSLGKVAKDAEIGHDTLRRFFEFGKGQGKMTYSYFHGPAVTTVFGIAGALGYEVELRKRR
jgi:hypothetical protein